MTDSDQGSDWAGARTLGSADLGDTADGEDSSLGARLRRRLRQRGHAPPQVGRFFIQHELGSGGMGTVFAAH
ncbi:MAG: hypothetical protein AAF721_04160, partial [Myxococcota bacterium]